METTTEEQEQKKIIRQRFDDALMEHMQRLLDKGRLPDKLPLNLLNVSCLMLMAEQQANEEKQFSTPEDRYTREALFQELAEMGLGSEAAFEAMLQLMLQMEYVYMDAAGLIEGREPALQMARHIDSILPQMPGLNLIAYIAQTIDEAISGRKELNDAVDQFDQTLMQQGVSAGKGRPEPREKRPGAPAGKTSMQGRHSNRKNPKSKSLLTAEDYKGLQQAFKKHAASSAGSSEPKIIASKGRCEKVDVQVVSFGARPLKAEAVTAEKLAGKPIVAEENSGEALAGRPEDRAPEDGAPEDGAAEDGDQETEDGGQRSDVGDQESEDGGKISSDGFKQDDGAEDTHTVEPEDDVIETRISAFEENLSMQCPICRSGEITAEQTAKKKTYYKCLNRACHFISWGKPYHKVCPRCHNPFLIEQERNGRTILKCPRSTCDYWQGHPADQTEETAAQQLINVKPEKPKPRRRVVRRKVVRRKKA